MSTVVLSAMKKAGAFIAVVALLLAAACASDAAASPTTLASTVIPASTPTAITQPTLTPTRASAPATPTPLAAATATNTPVPSATSTPSITSVLTGVTGIVDPGNLGWPREIETEDGRLTIGAPPQRIHTLSLGHDEMIVGLIGAGRLAGIGSFSADPIYSNVAAEVKDLPKIKRDAEAVLGLKPDLVIASKFTNKDLIDRIRGAGVPVIKTNLENSSAGNIPNLLLMGYVLGAEQQAVALANEIRARLDFIHASVADMPSIQRVSGLSIARFAESIDAAGGDTTEGGIIEAAGGVNAAARAGITGHMTVSLEAIAVMKPDIIIITQPEDSGAVLRDELYASPALVEVPAVKNRRIVIGDSRYYTTLSHWNVRGIEESAKLFYPDLFPGVEFKPFAVAVEPGR